MKITSTRTLDGAVLIWGSTTDNTANNFAVQIAAAHIVAEPRLAARYDDLVQFYATGMSFAKHGVVSVIAPVAWETVGMMVYIIVGGENPKQAFDDYEKTIAAIAACIQNQRND